MNIWYHSDLDWLIVVNVKPIKDKMWAKRLKKAIYVYIGKL